MTEQPSTNALPKSPWTHADYVHRLLSAPVLTASFDGVDLEDLSKEELIRIVSVLAFAEDIKKKWGVRVQ